MKIYAYKAGSRSAKALAAALKVKRIKHEGGGIAIKGTLINWGASSFSNRVGFVVGKFKILNHPAAVKMASNKLETFRALNGVVPVPDWTIDTETAHQWLLEANTLVVRHKLTGHSGEGIEIIEPQDAIPPVAPLYTKYIKKKEEYRLHVFGDECIFVQRKARRLDIADDQVNWKIRNHQNGFIYAFKDVDVPDDVKQIAVDAVKALGLDFGAVDMILGTDKKWYVLEVNTACGLEGETLNKYVSKFREYQ